MSKALYEPLSLESKKRMLRNRKDYLKRLTENYKIEKALILEDIRDLKEMIEEEEGERE